MSRLLCTSANSPLVLDHSHCVLATVLAKAKRAALDKSINSKYCQQATCLNRPLTPPDSCLRVLYPPISKHTSILKYSSRAKAKARLPRCHNALEMPMASGGSPSPYG
ncbi:hypothetical protein ASPBRDRAFT_285663 [Aspergillus brasiliensis CBS 101740]|uniref:Uncharacterized protein n=1 Tax=Aspergillus brasiliensis (strain CBS 101740 / IMI 381727 / IBT 21946) TaxID=767769 RepID=A0A1L9UDM6_ASPBC|nr:hypothetical protein ASPBRDRAFT_285663 [Aspergillus brasiliensis CBS 101740]